MLPYFLPGEAELERANSLLDREDTAIYDDNGEASIWRRLFPAWHEVQEANPLVLPTRLLFIVRIVVQELHGGVCLVNTCEVHAVGNRWRGTLGDCRGGELHWGKVRSEVWV